jgi:hypothetical protein
MGPIKGQPRACNMTSYAKLPTCPLNAGSTTTSFFHVRGGKLTKLVAELQETLQVLRVLLIDEFSLLGQDHFHGMHVATTQALVALGRVAADSTAAFGTLHVAMFGDLQQHDPVKALPLYATRNTTAAALRLYQQFTEVHLMSTRHRLLASNGGVRLGQLLDVVLCARPARAAVALLCDALQAKAVAPDAWSDVLADNPRVVALRHTVLNQLGPSLVLHHAANTGNRPLIWRADDQVVGGYPVGPRLMPVLRLWPTQKFGGIPAVGYFFPGCRYVFGNVHLSHYGHITNNECIGVSIVLDEREPPDTGAGGYRALSFPPKAVVVQPAGPPPPSSQRTCRQDALWWWPRPRRPFASPEGAVSGGAASPC